MYLRQNTLQPINFGPFLSSSDGFTPQTDLTIAQANMQLSKGGGAFSSIASGSATHDSDGWYTANLTADDVGTIGELKLKAMMTGTNTLPVWERWWVIEENIYDAFYGASAAGFDANQRVGIGFMQTGTVTAAALATDAVDEIVAGVWNEILTGATYNISSSAGRRLRQTADFAIREDVAQGSGTGNNQIQFDAGASAVDGAYDPSMVVIIEGTGVGQSRMIHQYDGASKTATVDRNWKVLPDATSVFQIVANPGREHVNEGLAQAGTADTITLNSLASPIDDVYVGQAVFIRSGTGDDQRKFVTAYNGTTKVATVHTPWATIPDSTSDYVMLPQATGDYITAQMSELTSISDIPATPTIPQALMLTYMRERNDYQTTTSERRILNDAGVEVLDAPMSDNGTVFSQGKLTDA